MRFVFDKVALRQVSVRVVVYPVGMISPVLYTYLYRHDILSSPGNLSNRNVLSGNWGALGGKMLSRGCKGLKWLILVPKGHAV